MRNFLGHDVESARGRRARPRLVPRRASLVRRFTPLDRNRRSNTCRARGRGLRRGAGPVLLFALGTALGVAALPTVRGTERPPSAATRTPAWHNASEYFLRANIYPSPRSAARGLGAAVADALGRSTDDDRSSPTTLRLDGTVSPALLDAVACGLQRVRPSLRVERSEATDASLLRVRRVAGDGATRLEGRLVGDREKTVEVPYVDKPWVDSFETFAAAHPEKRWAVARSPRPATAADEAVRLARRQAVEKLVGWIRETSDGGPIPLPWVGGDPLSDAVRAALRRGDYVADRFVQRFDRPTGDVYRAAWLLRLARDRADATLAAAHADRRRTLWSLAGQAGGLLLLVAVLAAGHVAIDTWTLGYYTLRLRLASGMALLLGATLVLGLV